MRALREPVASDPRSSRAVRGEVSTASCCDDFSGMRVGIDSKVGTYDDGGGFVCGGDPSGTYGIEPSGGRNSDCSTGAERGVKPRGAGCGRVSVLTRRLGDVLFPGVGGVTSESSSHAGLLLAVVAAATSQC